MPWWDSTESSHCLWALLQSVTKQRKEKKRQSTLPLQKKFLPSLFPSMLTKWLSQAKSVPAQCGTNTRPIKALGCHSGWFPMIRLHKLSNYYMALQFNRDTLGTQKRWELASTVWRWVLHLLDAGWKSLLCCGPRMRRTQYIWGHAYSAHHFIQPAPFAL